MNKKLLFLFLIVLNSSWSVSQNNFLKLKGTVVDSKTNIPLQFASIGIKEKSIGTISNILGQFEFSIPVSCTEDTLYIAMMGYGSYKKMVREIISENKNIFHLEQKVFIISEIIIQDQPLTADEIIEKSLLARKDNFSTSPYILFQTR